MRKQVEFVYDDITGEEGAESVLFGLDNTIYRIDLTPENTDALREALQPYVDAAQHHGPLGRVMLKPTTNGQQRGKSGEEHTLFVARVKAWAKTQSIAVPARGRIPSHVYEAYAAAGRK